MPVTVVIETPGNQAEVGGSFEASGKVSPPGAMMSARLRDAAAQEAQGESVTPARPGHDWTFRFADVPTDEALSLIVRGEDPQTFEFGEAMHTIRRAVPSWPPPATPASSAAAPLIQEIPPSSAPAPSSLTATPAAEEPAPALAGRTPEPELEEPAALPPVTVNPALAATGELPEVVTTRNETPPRKRVRPAARKKPQPATRKSARVPAGRRPKAAPAKASRSMLARRGRATTKKAAAAPAKKAGKKPAAKASKTGPKKTLKVVVKKSVKPAAKKMPKGKTARVAAPSARRGTKPTPRKASRAAAKTNPKKRPGR